MKNTTVVSVLALAIVVSHLASAQAPAQTGALGMGFWQNKNGQSIITGGAVTGGACNSGTWLRTFAPFQDLNASAKCAQVAAYVYNTIKAANAGGATMNHMLKAQMLATSLDSYFSDPTLGGNKISALDPVSRVNVDLTKVCEEAAACVDVRSAFGVVSFLSGATVSYLLNYAASQSNAGGSLWYGNAKAVQALAKDTFDAINNQRIFITQTVSNNTPSNPGLPILNPAAITAGVPAIVTISTFVSGATGGLKGAFLEQVDAGGHLLATLGSLNDAGSNGDLYAGDQIFTGQFTFNLATGTVWLRVSTLVGGVSNPVRSGLRPLEVLPAGIPLGPKYFPDSQIVTDLNEIQMPCDQVLALFNPGTSVTDITNLASSVGGVVVGFVPEAQVDMWQIQIPCTSAQGVVNAANTLKASPLVVAAQPNYLLQTAGVVPNDPGFIPCQWGTVLPSGLFCGPNSNAPELMLIRADSAWAITQGLSRNSDLGRPYPGPVIAIIDSGVDYTHEDLASPGKVIKGMNFIANTSDPMDDYGHGTGVAGVAAADGNNGIGIPGMSWASPIVAEKVVAANSYVNLDLLPAAINDALGHGAKIINISLGGSGTAGLDVIASALDIANKAGALVVAGAGNDHCSSPFYPAGFAQSYTLNGKTYDTTVLSVGGIDQDGNIATNTSTTCQHDTGSNFGPWVDLYAPWYAYTTESHLCNLDACSPGARYSLREGTSYSTPYVSGAAALVWAASPQANAKDVMQTLLATARPGSLDPLGNNTKVLNVFNAVFQAAATHCDACPKTPEVIVGPSPVFTGPVVSVGTVRGAAELQNPSVHGVSLPLTPIVGANSTVPLARILPLGYEVWLGYYLATWDSYTCCSPRSTTGGFFDSFSVSTSVAPYWELGLQGPISLFSIPSSDPLSAWLPPPGQPHTCEATAFPPSSPVCTFNAGLVFGGVSQGTQLQTIDSSLAGKKYRLPASTSAYSSKVWLNFVLDTATAPDSDDQLPSYGVFYIFDITPLCLDNQNPAGPLLAGTCVPPN